MTRDIKLYLRDITDAIKNIETYTRNMDIDAFIKDRRTMDAVVRNLSVIGEAVRQIPKEVKKRHPDIPWSSIAGMRNKIIHEYFGIDEEILWKTIQENIPDLKKKIKKIG